MKMITCRRDVRPCTGVGHILEGSEEVSLGLQLDKRSLEPGHLILQQTCSANRHGYEILRACHGVLECGGAERGCGEVGQGAGVVERVHRVTAATAKSQPMGFERCVAHCMHTATWHRPCCPHTALSVQAPRDPMATTPAIHGTCPGWVHALVCRSWLVLSSIQRRNRGRHCGEAV
jgi:hypothetical protein